MGARSWRSPKRIFAVIMGCVALLRGLAYIWPDGVPNGLQTLAVVPGGLVTWGWVWALIGAGTIAGAFTRRSTGLLIPFAAVNLLWGGSYLSEWVAVTIRTDMVSRDWITSVSYFALGAATLVVIRLVDPAEVRVRTEARHE